MNRRRRRERSALPGWPALRAFFAHHYNSLLAGPRRLAARPLGAAMTLGVIAIALAMPAGLHLVVQNLQRLGGQQPDGRQISAYLKPGIDAQAAAALGKLLKALPEVDTVVAVDPDQSLAEFEQNARFADALNMLGENPLPWVLLVTPATSVSGSEAVAELAGRIEAEAVVDFAQVDLQWLNRLNALLDLASRASAVLALILGVAVALIVGNTIRLELQTRSEEIAITRLLGATDGFVRRPFLYLGAWYGLLGGAAAALVVSALVMITQGPVSRLAASYDSQFELSALSLVELAALVAGGALIGWLGAALAVSRQISKLDPG